MAQLRFTPPESRRWSGETGAGASIEFSFENEDLVFSPDSENLALACADRKVRFCHTLNNTVIASPRASPGSGPWFAGEGRLGPNCCDTGTWSWTGFSTRRPGEDGS